MRRFGDRAKRDRSRDREDGRRFGAGRVPHGKGNHSALAPALMPVFAMPPRLPRLLWPVPLLWLYSTVKRGWATSKI